MANAFFNVNGMLTMGCVLFGRVFTVLIAPRLPHSQAPSHTRAHVKFDVKGGEPGIYIKGEMP